MYPLERWEMKSPCSSANLSCPGCIRDPGLDIMGIPAPVGSVTVPEILPVTAPRATPADTSNAITRARANAPESIGAQRGQTGGPSLTKDKALMKPEGCAS